MDADAVVTELIWRSDVAKCAARLDGAQDVQASTT